MGFLRRVKAAAEIIDLEDVYKGDPQFQQFIDSVSSLLPKFSSRFNLTDGEMLKLFFKLVEKEL
jgi:hypothetical protein